MRDLQGTGQTRLIVAAYGIVALVAVGIGTLRRSPNVLVCDALLVWPRWQGTAVSGLGGVALAAALVALTRWLVHTRTWATTLHQDLRPIARAIGRESVLAIAIASAVGEELLFRGALVPAIGIAGSSLIFGAVHQIRGRSRGVWILFATVVGALFAILFRATGSLLGPLLAHAIVNFVNFQFLLSHDPERHAQLGGLLGSTRVQPRR